MKTKKTIAIGIAGILTLFTLVVASAITINSGESTSFIVPEEYEYYSVVGNSTEVDIDVVQKGLNVTITIGKYARSDLFEVIFFNKEKEVIHHYTSSGGGGTRYVGRNVTEYVERNITKYIERDELDIEEDIIEDEGDISVLWYLLGGVVIGGGIYLMLHSRQKHKEEKDERKNIE